MSDKPNLKSADGNEEIEREIRLHRKFSLADAIGQVSAATS